MADKQVLMVTPSENGLAAYSNYLIGELQEIRAFDLEVYDWDISFLSIIFGLQVFSPPFLSKVRKSDIMHIQYSFIRYANSLLLIVIVCKILRTKIVVTQHDRNEHLPLSPIFFVYHQILYVGIDLILVHSQNRKNSIIRFHHDKVTVIPHGIINRPELEREPSVGSTILFPGIVRPIKGHDLAIKALADLPDHHELRIVGEVRDEQYYQQLKAQSEKLGTTGQITWMNEYVLEEKLFDEYKQADIAILPYKHSTPMSGILAHCISWQIPTVMSHAPVFTEIVSVDHAFFHPRTASELREQIKRVMGTPAIQREIIEEFQHLSRDQSWNAIAKQTRAAYDSTKR